MAQIDTIGELSPRVLGELKAWLEPWFQSRAQPADTGGGTSVETTDGAIDVNPTEVLSIGTGITLTNPAPREAHLEASGGGGGGGIDFNKLNNTDADGDDASYLWLRYIAATTLDQDTYGASTDYGLLCYMNQDEGFGGQMIVNNGGGVIGLDNTGDGIFGSVMGGSIAKFDGPPVAGGIGANVGVFLRSSGDGAVWIKNESGPVILDSRHDVIFITSVGNDINDVGVKISTGFNDFLVQGDQSITRNGSGVITAITPSAPALRIFPGSTNHVWLYNLPTSSSGLSSGQLWRNSNVLTVVP